MAFVVGVLVLQREAGSCSDLLREVEQRRATEQHLRLQTTALEAAANAVVITDAGGTIVWVNPSFSRLTGYSSEEVLGNKPGLLKSKKHDSTFYEHMWRTILSGAVWHGEVTNRRKDGTLYVEEMTITPWQRDHAFHRHQNRCNGTQENATGTFAIGDDRPLPGA